MQLKTEAQAYKRTAFALSTQRTYKSQLRCYLEFCLEYKCSPLPVEQETLISYIAFLARKLQASSIPNYLNVIRLLHLEAGFNNPLAGNFEVNLIKKGINRQLGVPPKQKEPITLCILRKIHVLLDVSKPSDLAFWAA